MRKDRRMNKLHLEVKTRRDPAVVDPEEDRLVTEEEGRAARSGTWEGAD